VTTTDPGALPAGLSPARPPASDLLVPGGTRRPAVVTGASCCTDCGCLVGDEYRTAHDRACPGRAR
jgi:hypothetical protein